MKNSIFNAVCKTRYLALLVVLIFTCGNAWGATATNNCGSALSTSYTDMESGKQIEWKVSSANTYSSPIRVYASTTITIHAKTGYKITKVVVTAYSTGNYVTYTQNATWAASGSGDCSVSARTVSSKDITANITGTANTVTISPSTQTRWSKVVVTYESAGKTDPTASFSNGTYTIGGDALDLSSLWTSNSDGAVTYTVTSAGGTGASISTASFTATTAGSCTVKASQAATASYNAIEKSATITVQNPTCATPTFSPAEGAYLGTQSVTISCATGGSSIYYTTDGSTPTTSSTLYSGAISVSSTTTIQAIATKSGYANSTVASATYTITPAYTVTWKNQGTTVTTTNVASGSKPVFPDMTGESGCQTYTYFYGWAEDTWSGEVTSPGTSSTVKVYKSASEMPNVSADVTYHAVWSDSEGGWTPASSISVGDVVLLVNASGTTTYELGGISTTSTKYGLLHEYDTDPDEIYPLTVGLGYNDENYSFKNGSNYLYWSSGNSLNVNSTLSTNTSWTVSIDADTKVATIRNVYDNARYLQYNTGSRFACYTNSCANPMLLKESASGNCVTSCCNQLAAPANPGETPNSTGAVLTWDAVTGATGYEVKIDDGAWTSTGNGTTTGYTITGKTCGGTSVSWQVRATGNGTTNCEKGAATTARNFTTTACACTAYSFHYQHGSDWNTDNICFTAVTGATNNYLTDEMYLPYAEWYKVGWQGADQSYTVAKGFTGTTNNIPMPFYHNREKSFGANPQSGNIGGGKGRFHVYHDSGSTNKYVSFIPTGYTINFGTGDTWSNDLTLNFTGKTNAWDETEWYTEMTTLTDEQIGKKIFVGLQTALGYVWCDPYSQKDNLSGLRTKSGSGESWVSGGMTTAYPNKTGKFRIYANSGDKNWYVTFVPHYQLTYNANGGTGTMNPLPETPVSCEETLANRTVTVGACTFAAPSHKEFKEWNTQADGNGTTIATGSRELTGDLKLYAIWKNESYSISATMTNVTSGTNFPVAYTYTGSAANVTYTFVASSGYRLPDNVTVTGSTYTWDQATGQLTLTGIITGPVSITVTAVQTHTIHWLVNGVDYTGKSPVTVDHGSSLTFPTPNPSAPGACDSKTFVGWTSDSEITTETNTAPTLISEGTAVDGDATYRAVFADVTGYPDKFKRVTQLSDISEGSQIAIGFYVTSNIKLCGLDFNEWTTYSCATGVTEDGNSRIDKPSAANTWNVSKSGNYWVFTNAGDGSTKMGIGTTSSNNPLDPASTTYYKWEIGANSSGTNHFYLRLYDGSAMTYCALELYQSTWKIYDVTSSGTHVYSSSAYTALKLYVPAGTRTNYITQCSSCTTPSSVTASDVTNNSATISWSGVSQTQQVGGSGTGFTVLWGTDATRANNSNTANVAAGTTTYNLTGLSEGTHYYVWVQSKCDDSWCATPADFTTLVSHTATFYDVDGTTPLQSGSVIEGSAITYSGSTPVSCDAGVDASTTFVGWASAPWEDKLAKGSIPSTFYDIVGGESLPNMGNSNMSFYPVFAKATGDPLTNHAWTYTFSAQTYKANDTKTLAGTEGGNTVNADWALLTYNQSSVAITNWGSFDNDRGSKIGKNDDDYVTYMYLSSASFDGTITAVKISTSGNSGVTANVSATVGGTTFYNGVNSSLDISSSNAEYSFTGSKAISGDDEVVFIWEQETAKALYIKKIEVDYTTGGSITYSNYMTTCSQCTTPSGLEASSITEAGATITWSGTSNSGTTGFKVLWSTNSSRPEPATGNNGDTNAETKTYSITGLNAGTTYYVWVQSKCDGSWSSSINFTTKAIHAITLTADNGTIVGGSPINVVDGATLTFPNVTGTSCGSFVGWTIGDYDNVAAPATLYANGAEKANITADESYKALYRTASGAETNVTDNWTGTKIGVSIYDDWSGKVDASAAVYAGNSTKNSSYSNCLQLRSTNNSGIITTTSGGKAKKVTVTWNSNTTNGNTLDVYGKNTAYSAVSDLYSNDANVKGTKIGSIVKGTSTELTIDGDYAYIGVRSNSGALYIDNLAIEWYGLPMKYTTAPACDPMVSMTSSFSTFSYVYAAGPSSSQSFTVSGIQLGADLVVTAPANYEVCKTADGTYTSSVSYTPTDGAVAATVYIRLAAGLNVGTYNYVAASGVAVTSTGATTANAALNGSVTKADCAITFTDFNAVDHYEGVLEYGSSVTVSYNYTYPGDGTFSITHSPNTGTFNKTDKTLTVSVAGIWTLNASATAGSNYNKPANASAEIRVKCVDTYVDFIHNKTIKAYGSGSTVTDGKMEDWGSGYTVPYIDDNATETSGSCQQTHFKFVGWVSEDDINIADGTFKPGYTLIEAGTAEKRATTKTYYAVWAKQEE